MENLVLVVMVSWFTTLGFQHTQTQWANYAYRTPPTVVSEGVASSSLPSKLLVDSPDYWRLQKEQAAVQIKQMRDAGIDGVLFDLMPRPRLYRPEAYNASDISTHPTEFFKLFGIWLDAAKESSPNFKVGIFLESEQRSAEEPNGRTPSIGEWVAILDKVLSVYGDHPSLLHINNKPCLVNFNTTGNRLRDSGVLDPSGGWKSVIEQLNSKGKPVYFVSDIRPRDVKLGLLSSWTKTSDALQIFAPAAPISFGTTYQEKIAGLVAGFGGNYWWSVYPGYYRKGRDYSPPDFRRIHELWMGAIKAKVSVVEVLTWNDINERGEIWPSNINGDVLLQITSFYSKWYKSGRLPAIDKDKIFLACPVQINNAISAKTPNWPNYLADSTNYDSCYYWAYLNKSNQADLTIEDVGSIRLHSGISFGVIGKVRQAGVKVVHVKTAGREFVNTTRDIVDGGKAQENLVYFYFDASPTR